MDQAQLSPPVRPLLMNMAVTNVSENEFNPAS